MSEKPNIDRSQRWSLWRQLRIHVWQIHAHAHLHILLPSFTMFHLLIFRKFILLYSLHSKPISCWFSLANSQRSLLPQTSFSNSSCHAFPATVHGYRIAHSSHQLEMLACYAIFRRNLARRPTEPNWTRNVLN